ncbi:ubiquitin carboxyl-terminal hydrolase 15 [Anabrus simplex]|uniref:ubiquitin carboxyl-terminal hydrolase 15 n=1 Tax=Anabrus simplex TaxID=316456 RepID=UPI0035A2E053
MEIEKNGDDDVAYPVCVMQELLHIRKITRDLLEKQLVKDDLWFLVDQKWFAAFKKYVGLYSNWTECIGEKHPGPVDNSSLFKDNELKEDLQQGVDFLFVPIELWNHFICWFGIVEGQKPLARKKWSIGIVIEFGLFVRHCTIELYLIRLKLYKDFDMSFSILENFSKADSIVHIAETCRRLYNIPDDTDVRLWSYTTNYFQPLEMTSNVHYEALYTDQTIVVETSVEGGSCHRQEKYSTYLNTFIHRGIQHLSAIADRTSTCCGAQSSKYENVSQLENTRASEIKRLTDVCFEEQQVHSTREVPGLCGLLNIGNTCFMNSIIQCMSNCPPVTKYFIEGHYVKELNKTNPLGRRGEIASAYGSLIKTLWSGQHTCTAPKNFKLQVGKFAPQFLGTSQHDCHELLTFLLDGLHEDLNRIVVKPSIELSDSVGRPDEEMANEAWRNHLKCNDSIIIENFHGLLKSTVVCPLCSKSSVTFDPFCYLSLPLPVKNERCIEVTLFPHESWKIPNVYKVMVPENGFIHDLLLGLNLLCGLSPDELLVTEIERCRFRRFFSNEDLLASIGLDDYIVVYEVPNLDNHIRVPVCLWEYKMHKFSLNHLFGHPVMVVVPENSFTAENMYEMVLMKLCRYLTNPDREGPMWLLQLNKMNDDSEISAAALKHLISSLPQSLFSFHVIEGYTVDEFPDDSDRASALFSDALGRRYLAAQWKSEDRAEYFSDDILDDTEQHESVSHSETDKTSLLDCLKLYTMCEKLGADDAWYCPTCKQHQRASKRIELSRLPAILVIHLKRFMYTQYAHDKINTYVEFPMEDLDVSEFVIDRKHQSTKYKLIGVCNHFGALGSGHYTAYALHKPTNQWYEFDDSRVTQVPSHSVVTNSAYVLFYLKQD